MCDAGLQLMEQNNPVWVNSKTQLHCTMLCYRYFSPFVVLSCGGGDGSNDGDDDLWCLWLFPFKSLNSHC